MSDNPLETRKLGYLFALGQVGMEMVVPLVGGLFADHYFGTSPWLTVIGAVAGFAAGITHLLMLLNQMDKLSKKEPPEQSKGP